MVKGTGLFVVGSTLKLSSFALAITGVALGGSPGLLLTVTTTAPSVVGGGLLLTGAWLRGRADAHGEVNASDGYVFRERARRARRVGWPLFGVGLGLQLGTSIALAAWPFGPSYDDGAPALYPVAFAAVGSVFALAPLLIGAGSSALAWAETFEKADNYAIKPTISGVMIQF